MLTVSKNSAVSPAMKDKLLAYAAKFNAADEEIYIQDIDNAHAAEWMLWNIPLIDIPDKTLEETYYFRYWTLRKHQKTTADGVLMSEFLPPVPWAGKHNMIIAAVGHHVSEAKWLRCGKAWLTEYLSFWLHEPANTYLYSTWLPASVLELCRHHGDWGFAVRNLDKMIRYWETTAREHKTPSGLFWSIDGNDAMEFSISGTGTDGKAQKGIRPTLNAYMAASARAIAETAEIAGREDTAREYREKYETVRGLLNEYLWDGDFYKAIHPAPDGTPDVHALPAERSARELIGYIPWCFDLPPAGRESAFRYLLSEKGFDAPYGLTTAERAHPRFLYESAHECMWNGYVWPFATAQTLTAVIRLMETCGETVVTGGDFYRMLKTYAAGHKRTLPDGTQVPWIDEKRHPLRDEWTCRDMLASWGWRPEKGGRERGKDYNHSTFCDLLLRGVLGLRAEDGVLTAAPRVPADWESFTVENLWCGDECHAVSYKKEQKNGV